MSRRLLPTSIAGIAAGIAVAFALVNASAAPAASSLKLNPQPEPPGVARVGDPMAAIYDKAVVITNKGRVEKLWFHADHSFAWEGPKGQHGEGRWQLTANNSRICLSPIRTPETANESAATRCAEFVAGHHRGDRWTQKNDANEPITVEVR